MELVKIATAGSVDDGKSTLIGRLLYDNQALTHEQLALVKKKSEEKGLVDLDFSVLTDGLTAEREQGITIDVAHVYFSTESHKFILADSPGHVEYTRNMVTGASNTDVSIILIDARKGLLEQTYRHYFIANLLRQRKVIFCINKMDLQDYSEDVFLKIAVDVKKLVERYEEVPEYAIIPISSLKGDNVVNKSFEMPWYSGKTLNDELHAPLAHKEDLTFRFDVQQVYHVQNSEFTDFRGYAGRVLGGEINLGDEIKVLPSGQTAKVTEIRKFTETFDQLSAGESAVLSLNKELGIDRGSLFVRSNDTLSGRKTIDAKLVWLNEQVGSTGNRFILKSSSFETQVKLAAIQHKIDPISGGNEQSDAIKLNDISEVSLQSAQELFLDAYKDSRENGVFILISPQTNATLALGFVK